MPVAELNRELVKCGKDDLNEAIKFKKLSDLCTSGGPRLWHLLFELSQTTCVNLYLEYFQTLANQYGYNGLMHNAGVISQINNDRLSFCLRLMKMARGTASGMSLWRIQYWACRTSGNELTHLHTRFSVA